MNVSDATLSTPTPGPISLTSAKNEWTSFAVQLEGVPSGTGFALRLNALQAAGGAGSIDAAQFEVFQVLTMPVDVARAGYVRHAGAFPTGSTTGRLPRALLPAKAVNGNIRLGDLRDPARPTDPNGHFGGGKVDLWVDLHVPADAAAGEYGATCDVIALPDAAPSFKPGQPLDASGAATVRASRVSVPLKLLVYNFALPTERHLEMIGRLPWDALKTHYGTDFERITPQLVNRAKPRYAGAVKVMDGLVGLAQHHRLSVVIPTLQPTVKWPARLGNGAPNTDWSDFDTIVESWFSGAAFPDKIPLTYWPLPKPVNLENYDLDSRLSYWSQAATHFDQNDWLDKTSVTLEKPTPGRANTRESLNLSADAAAVLGAHARVRVTVPLEDQQVQLAGDGRPGLVDPNHTSRLLTACPSLVFNPQSPWPEGDDAPKPPEHWLRTDLPGLVPYVGAGGDERDVRLWAWLAFLRKARFVQWGDTLPSRTSPTQPADPNELIWFYPGSWFGTDEPLPTVQLKWLRRAQQDYEYLWLAQDRDNVGACRWRG